MSIELLGGIKLNTVTQGNSVFIASVLPWQGKSVFIASVHALTRTFCVHRQCARPDKEILCSSPMCGPWQGHSMFVASVRALTRTFCVHRQCARPDKEILCSSPVCTHWQGHSVFIASVRALTRTFCVHRQCARPDKDILCSSPVRLPNKEIYILKYQISVSDAYSFSKFPPPVWILKSVPTNPNFAALP